MKILTNVSKDLSFEVTKGEVFCIYGKSGIGKTTLLKTLSGLHKEFSGNLEKKTPDNISYFSIFNLLSWRI